MYIWFLGWSGHGAFCSAQMVLKPIWTKSGAKTLVSKYLYYVLNQGISKVYRIFPCCNALIFMYSHLNGYLFHLQWVEIIFERSWMINLHFHDNIYTTFISERVVERDPKYWYLFSPALFIVNSGHWGIWLVLISIVEQDNLDFPGYHNTLQSLTGKSL